MRCGRPSAVRRQPAFAELTSPRGRQTPTAGKVVDHPSRVLSEPAVTMSPREPLTRSDPASAAAGAHPARQDGAMRASFVPSLGMTEFFVFNTVYWLVMAVVRYEFSAYFNAEGGNAFSGAVLRGCCGWLTGWAVHLILSRPGMLDRPLVIRVVVGLVISILAALAFFVLVPSL